MCRWLAVSRSGYYEHKTRPVSQAKTRTAYLARAVIGVFKAFDGIYGHRRVGAHLRRAGIEVCDETVRRLMRANAPGGLPAQAVPAGHDCAR
jgi:hypothetical protein